MDIDLSLYRLCARSRLQYEFIPIKSIIYGALIVENPNEQGEYFAVDIIDLNIFMQVRELHKAHFKKQ